MNPSDFSLYGSICLSDIPKQYISTSANGKKYLNISIRSRREVSQWGHTHNIIVDVPKEQRTDGQKPCYIGNLKTSAPQPSQQQQPQTSQTESIKSSDDLPF